MDQKLFDLFSEGKISAEDLFDIQKEKEKQNKKELKEREGELREEFKERERELREEFKERERELREESRELFGKELKEKERELREEFKEREREIKGESRELFGKELKEKERELRELFAKCSILEKWNTNTISTYSYSKFESLGQIEVNVDFWNFIGNPGVDGKIIISRNFIKSLSKCNSEADTQACLSSNLPTIFGSTTLKTKILDTHLQASIDKLKPDWCFVQDNLNVETYWIDIVGETKIPSMKDNHSTIGQVFQYLETLLRADPSISTRFGFIISNSQISFISADVKSLSTPSNIKFQVSKSYPLIPSSQSNNNVSDGLSKLYSLAEYCHSGINRNIPPDILSKLTKDEKLKSVGCGLSSHIFQIGNRNSVYKVFKKEMIGYLPTELKTLKELNKHNIKGIPRLGESSSNWIEIIPKCENINFDSSSYAFSNLIDTIYNFHSKGYVHRDIRASNLVISITNRGEIIYVIDWGFSVPKNKKCLYEGTLPTASDRILKILDDQGPSCEFICYPSDDLISFIRTYITIKYEGVKSILSNYKNPGDIIQSWRSASIPTFYQRLIDKIPEGDVPIEIYELVKSELFL